MTLKSWAAATLVILLLAAAAAPLVAPVAPDALDLAHRRASPSLSHWFGTDELGRDLLTRVLFGARVSLAVGLCSAAIAGAVGVLVGGVAGYVGGMVDQALMRLTDAMLAVPRLPLLMIASAVLLPPVPMLIVLIGVASWMDTARITRAEFLSLRSRDFVEAARACGAGDLRIAIVHLLTNAAPAISVSITIGVGRAILLESALSFFGVGVQPPAASWGNMLYQAQSTLTTEPWLAIFPGAFIFVTALAINRLGEGLASAAP